MYADDPDGIDFCCFSFLTRRGISRLFLKVKIFFLKKKKRRPVLLARRRPLYTACRPVRPTTITTNRQRRLAQLEVGHGLVAGEKCAHNVAGVTRADGISTAMVHSVPLPAAVRFFAMSPPRPPPPRRRFEKKFPLVVPPPRALSE